MSKKIEEVIGNKIVSLIKAEKDVNEEIEIKKLSDCLSINFYNIPAIRIKWGKKKKYISLNPIFKHLLQDFSSFEIENIKSNPWIRIVMPFIEHLEQIYPLVLLVFDEAFLVATAEQFSCCSRYERCSDEKHCVHPEHLFAIGCSYNKNLKNGKIFYGENRTI